MLFVYQRTCIPSYIIHHSQNKFLCLSVPLNRVQCEERFKRKWTLRKIVFLTNEHSMINWTSLNERFYAFYISTPCPWCGMYFNGTARCGAASNFARTQISGRSDLGVINKCFLLTGSNDPNWEMEKKKKTPQTPVNLEEGGNLRRPAIRN